MSLLRRNRGGLSLLCSARRAADVVAAHWDVLAAASPWRLVIVIVVVRTASAARATARTVVVALSVIRRTTHGHAGVAHLAGGRGRLTCHALALRNLDETIHLLARHVVAASAAFLDQNQSSTDDPWRVSSSSVSPSRVPIGVKLHT